MIPWKLFWVLSGQIPALQALDRLHQAGAVAQGAAIALGGREQADRIERELMGEIFGRLHG